MSSEPSRGPFSCSSGLLRGCRLTQLAITAIRAVIPLLVLGVAKLFVDVAVEVIGGGTLVLPVVGVPADPAQGLYLLGGVLLSVWLLDKATGAVEEVVRTHSTNRVESHVHALIMRKCSTLDAAFYESPKYLDMLERAVRGALMNALSFMWGFYFLMQAAISAGRDRRGPVDDTLGDSRGDGAVGIAAAHRHELLRQAGLGAGEQPVDALPAPEVSHRIDERAPGGERGAAVRLCRTISYPGFGRSTNSG